MRLHNKKAGSAIKAFINNQQGATAIEYGFIAAMISMAAIVALTGVGGQLKKIFQSTSVAMSVANAAAS